MSRLDELRARMREIDARILALVADRMETARQIGQEKKAAGIPLRDWNVERQVLDRAADHARRCGLPPGPVRALMRVLIATSRDEQERLSYSDYAGAAEDIAVLGGCGAMGRWFVDFLGNQGHRVHVYDPAVSAAGRSGGRRSRTSGGTDAEAGDSSSLAASPTASGTRLFARLSDALAGTGFALIATPLDIVPDVIDALTRLRYGGVVFDIASLKDHLRPAIERARAAGVGITSIHPLFGAGARSLSDQVICLCDCGDAEATARVEAFFAETAATLVRLSFERHDRIMSYVLGFSHLINLLFARVLMAGGMSLSELNRVGSTTFHSQMVTTATVIRENPELYYAIQRLNPFSRELHETLRAELETILSWIEHDDHAAFVEMMDAGRRWMEGQ